MNIFVREERPGDRDAIRAVNQQAFGRPDEADLVDALQAEGAILLSLVAEADGAIAGHILFSRMRVETPEASVPAVALAPLAVLPQNQNRGIGSKLARDGIARLRDRGEKIVIVLGHKNYYPRFGFTSEKARDLENPFPPDAYMALELIEGALMGVRGRVQYPAAFGLWL